MEQPPVQPRRVSPEVTERILQDFEDSRREISNSAEDMIKVLKGDIEGIVLFDSPRTPFDSVPTEIPIFNVEQVHHEEGTINHLQNIGEYYAKRNYDKKPSDAFNIGFLTGMLAVREMLSVPTQPEAESDSNI